MEKYRLKTKEIFAFKWMCDKSLIDEIKGVIDPINESGEYPFRLKVGVAQNDSDVLCLSTEEGIGCGTSFCRKGQYALLDLNSEFPFNAVDKKYIDKYYENW